MKVVKLVCGAIVFCSLSFGLPALQATWADGGKTHPEATKHVVYSGQFTAVDVAGSNVTLAGKNGETKTVAITGETKIEVNGKAATLADVQVGMHGGVKIAADGNAAIMLKANSHSHGAAAKYSVISGRFTAVNVAQSNVTLTNKEGEAKTVTVAANAKIEVNGKAATLADVQVGMHGGVKVPADGNAATMLRAHSPK